MEFFRHCPECGRRFHIKLESKNLVSEHRESTPGRKELRPLVIRGGGRPGSGAYMATPDPIAVQEGKPIIVDIEEFQYAYKCKHCGHEWSEKHLESRRES
jgi:DNA-directed RNA polymerase subunit RPC12/RpoP